MECLLNSTSYIKDCEPVNYFLLMDAPWFFLGGFVFLAVVFILIFTHKEESKR